MSTLLLDTDIIAYICALKCETKIDGFTDEPLYHLEQDEETCFKYLQGFVDSLAEKLKPDHMIACMSDPDVNWRKAILPHYKGNRTDAHIPFHLAAAKNWFVDSVDSRSFPTLEADDVMGILATNQLLVKDPIICTKDKDLYTIPAKIYNLGTGTKRRPTVEEADIYHMSQVLSGDLVDGYGGIPRVGEKVAHKLLYEGLAEGKTLWEVVMEQYEDWEMTEEDALAIARVARICRNTDYDHSKGEVILWEIPQKKWTGSERESISLT